MVLTTRHRRHAAGVPRCDRVASHHGTPACCTSRQAFRAALAAVVAVLAAMATVAAAASCVDRPSPPRLLSGAALPEFVIAARNASLADGSPGARAGGASDSISAHVVRLVLSEVLGVPARVELLPGDATADDLLANVGNATAHLAILAEVPRQHTLDAISEYDAAVVRNDDLDAATAAAERVPAGADNPAVRGAIAPVKARADDRVLRMGEIGAEVRGGWYAPQYMIDANPAAAFDSACLSDADAPRAAAIEAAFGGAGAAVAIAGPAAWGADAGLAGCGPSGLWAVAAGVDVECVHNATEAEHHEHIRALAEARAPFVAFLYSPSALLMDAHRYGGASPLSAYTRSSLPAPPPLNLTRLSFAPWREECHAARQCDYPALPLSKYAWAELPVFFPPDAVAALSGFRLFAHDLNAMLAAYELVAVAEASGSPPAGVSLTTPADAVNSTSEAIACAWVRAHGEDVASLTRTVRISRVSPSVGPASGGTWVAVEGEGFGSVAPIRLSIQVGGRTCPTTRWESDSRVWCLLPAGAGSGLSFTLQIGFVAAEAVGVFAYEIAVLRGVGNPSHNRNIQRVVTSGESVIVAGDHFAEVTELQCSFGEDRVIARYLNATALECVAPLGHHGFVPVGVTNDGVRWSNGIFLSPDEMVWPGGLSGRLPTHFNVDSAPAELTVVLYVTDGSSAAYAHDLVEAVAAVNANSSVLPFTTLQSVVVSASPVLDLASDERAAASLALLQSTLADHPSTVAVVGASPSSGTMALVNAVSQLGGAGDAGASPRLLTVSPTSTNPALSNETAFPAFLRLVPSDTRQGVALVALLEALHLELTALRLWDTLPSAREVALVQMSDDAYAGTVASLFLEAVADSSAFDVAVDLDLSSVASAASGSVTQQEAEALLAPLADGGDHDDIRIVVLSAPARVMEPVMLAAEELNLAGDRHLWVGPDALAGSADAVAYLPHVLAVTPGAGRSSAVDAMYDASETLFGTATLPGPFIRDAVWTIATACDDLVRERHSTAALDYADGLALRALAKQRRIDAVTSFGGYEAGTNDPALWAYDVVSISDGDLDVVGLVNDKLEVTLDGGVDALRPSLPDGNGAYVYAAPAVVEIGVIFQPDNEQVRHIVAGAEAALAEINADGGAFLGGSTMRVRVGDLRRGPEVLVPELVADSPALVGFLGPRRSGNSMAFAPFVEETGKPQISPSATNSLLSDPVAFPNFLRTVASDSLQAFAIVETMRRFRWGRVVSFRQASSPYSTGLEANFFSAASDVGLKVPFRFELTDGDIADPEQATLGDMFQQARDAAEHVFLVATGSDAACVVVQAAIAAGMSGADYVIAGVDGWISVHSVCASDDDAADNVNAALTGSVGTNPASYVGQIGAALIPVFEAQLSTNLTSAHVVGDATMLTAIDDYRASVRASVAAGSPVAPSWAMFASYAAVKVFAEGVRRAFALGRDVTDGPFMTSTVRGVQALGPAGSISFVKSSNDLVNAGFDIANRNSAHGVAVVGTVTDVGYVEFRGCGPGTWRDLSGKCEPCPLDTFKSTVGDGACTPCPSLDKHQMSTAGRFGATNVTDCVCPILWIQPADPAAAAQSDFPCDPCPEGGVCDSRDLPLSEVKNRAGYWRGSPDSRVFTKCDNAAACPTEGLTVPLPSDVYDTQVAIAGRSFRHSTPCREGHVGVLCGICEPGYGRASNGLCARCKDETLTRLAVGSSSLLTVVVSVALAYLQAATHKVDINSKRRANAVKVAISWFQFQGQLAIYTVDWGDLVTAVFGFQASTSSSVSFVSIDCIDQGGSHSPALSNFTLYMLQPVGGAAVCLVLVAVTHVMAILWGKDKKVVHFGDPTERARSASRGSAAVTPMSAPQAPSTASRTGGAAQSVGDTSKAGGLDLLRAGVGAVKTANKLDKFLHRAASEGRLVTTTHGHFGRWFDGGMWRDVVISFAVTLAYMLFPTSCVVVLGMLDCTTVDGRDFLRIDYSVPCDSEVYATYHAWAVVCVFAYIIGVPLVFGLLLAVNFKALYLNSTATRVNRTHTLVVHKDVEAIEEVLARMQENEKWDEVYDCRIGQKTDDEGTVAKVLGAMLAAFRIRASPASAALAPGAASGTAVSKVKSVSRLEMLRRIRTRFDVIHKSIEELLAQRVKLTLAPFKKVSFSVARPHAAGSAQSGARKMTAVVNREYQMAMTGGGGEAKSADPSVGAGAPAPAAAGAGRASVVSASPEQRRVPTATAADLETALATSMDADAMIDHLVGAASTPDASVGEAHAAIPTTSDTAPRQTVKFAPGSTPDAGRSTAKDRGTGAVRSGVDADSAPLPGSLSKHHSPALMKSAVKMRSFREVALLQGSGIPNKVMRQVSHILHQRERLQELLQAAFEDTVSYVVQGDDDGFLAAVGKATRRLLGLAPVARRKYSPTLNEGFRHIVEKMGAVASSQRKYGFVFMIYRPGPGSSFVEVTVLARKAILIVSSVFLAGTAAHVQIATGLLIVLSVVALNIWVEPFCVFSVYKRNPRYQPAHVRLLRKTLHKYKAAKRLKMPDVPDEALEPPPKPWLAPWQDVLAENLARDKAWAEAVHACDIDDPSIFPGETREERRVARGHALYDLTKRPPELQHITEMPLPRLARIPERVPTDALERTAFMASLTTLCVALYRDRELISEDGMFQLDVFIFVVNLMTITMFAVVIAADMIIEFKARLGRLTEQLNEDGAAESLQYTAGGGKPSARVSNAAASAHEFESPAAMVADSLRANGDNVVAVGSDSPGTGK